MAASSSSNYILCVSLLLLLSGSSVLAFNITKILDEYPDFGTFNSLLSQTKLAAEINSRSTITVLAVDDGAAGALSGKPVDEQKRILSVHVVLDYYDEKKLSNLKKKSTLMTTLYQSSGVAVNQQGFLNITKDKSGEVRLGSAVPGAGLTATIVKEVTTQPFNISVLQVSGIIYPTGIDNVNSTAPAAAPPPKAAKTPAGAPKASAEAPEASAPGSEESEGAPSPASSSSPADAPAADEDAPSVAPAPADGPSASDAAPVASDAPAGSDASSPGPSSEDSADSSASPAAVPLLAVVVGIISMVIVA